MMAAADSGSKKIVIIDDNGVTVYAIAEWLRELGYEPLGETDGHAGLSRIAWENKAHRLSGVLLDLHMPVYSGLLVLQELQRKYRDVPVIAMADAERSDEVWDALRRGAQDFLVKPLTAALVQHKCRAVFLERDTPD